LKKWVRMKSWSDWGGSIMLCVWPRPWTEL